MRTQRENIFINSTQQLREVTSNVKEACRVCNYRLSAGTLPYTSHTPLFVNHTHNKGYSKARTC